MKQGINTTSVDDHHGYNSFLKAIQTTFDTELINHKNLFTTNTENLFDLFLENIPEESRQHYNCRACKYFIDSYGGLVAIDSDGYLISAMWNYRLHSSLYFKQIVKIFEGIVLNSKVTGVFYSNKKEWGYPITNDWHHMHIIPQGRFILRDPLKTPFQKSAEKKEDFKMLMRSFKKYPKNILPQAIALLKTEKLYRSEKCLGVAEWFYEIYPDLLNFQVTRTNQIWDAVASAPPGFAIYQVL